MVMQTLLGLRDFWPEDRIIALAVQETKTEGNAQSLLLFSTSKQHTWLVCCATELYCVMDDIRHPAPDIRWRMTRDEVMQGSTLKMELASHEYKPVTGKIDLGSSHMGWLYSMGLFQGKRVEDAVRELIERNMARPVAASSQAIA